MENLIKEFLRIGSGDGDGYGDGYGSGSGDGYGYGDGSGDGSGDGDGSGYGIKSVNGKIVYRIDRTATLIESVRGNVAKGYILHSDLTLTPCYVVKGNGKFAHGGTLHEAYEALQEKLYDDSTEDERIEKFNEHFADRDKKYPAKELFIWHHVLTGSCKVGRTAFCKDKGIDIDRDEFTVAEFIAITKDAYGGEIIRRLEDE